MSRTFSVIFLAIVMCIVVGCSKGPPRFQKAQIEMSVEDFEARYPQAQRITEVKGTDGIPFSIYAREPQNKMQKAEYYFSEDKLVGIIILYSQGAEFDSVVDGLAASNGEPTKQFMMANSKAAVWEQDTYFINLIQGATETEIKLPTGVTQLLAPGDIVVMLGRKDR